MDARKPFPVLSILRSAAAGIALLAAAVHAQPVPGGAELGSSLAQLRQAVPGLRPVAHPARLAEGLVGGWAGPTITIAGVAVTPTFFLAGGELRRVEYLAAEGEGTAGFDALLAWGRAAWGPELASRSPEGDYATWAGGELDAYLQQTGAPRPRLRLVLKRRQVKEGSEL